MADGAPDPGARRFGVGDRVKCKVSQTQWKRGIVAKLDYRAENWPADKVAPYQVKLLNGVLIFVPIDNDSLVRADDGEELEPVSSVEIHVCQAGPCRRAGGEAVLLEIEELAKNVGGAVVQSSGCLGNCSNAPNALVEANGSEQIFAKLCTLSATAELVERATGRAPNLGDAGMVARLERARRLRVRMEAREESKWNLALAGLAEDVEQAEDEEDKAELVQEHAELLAAAGLVDRALAVLATVAPPLEEVSLGDIPGLRLLLDQAKILAGAGRLSSIDALRGHIDQLQPRGSRESDVKAQVLELLVQACIEIPLERVNSTSLRVQDYARWRLRDVSPVSKHSAIYHFRTDDAARGTPIRKGRGGRTVWSRTWHTTLLAEVGEASNKEGPLPWIERDYTPISTAHDWEQGRCDILIKLYLEPAGLATEWLHRISSGVGEAAAEGDGAKGNDVSVWLSRPMKTLPVPSLSLDEKYLNRKHASVLLVVAGTGVVAVPQVLHHANPATCFGGRPPINQPISVIYSCRTDDALLIPELASWCREGALTRCSVLLTAPQPARAPFPEAADVDVAAAFADVDNAEFHVNARLSPETLQAELSLLKPPLRVVVSGPESFNGACKSMLKRIDENLGAEAVTILSA